LIQLDGKVSIIIPGYNEGKSIFQNLEFSNAVFLDMFQEFEIVFVNDGSIDNTLVMAKNAAKIIPCLTIIDSPLNEGKGNALRLGTLQASGKYIVFMDADLELPPTQLPTFFGLLKSQNADVVIGSKLHPKSIINYPPGRKFVSFCYFIFIAFLFNQKFHDTQTGLKLFKAEVIKPVMKKIQVKRFAFDVEMMVMIARKKWNIVESPIIMEYKREQKWGRIRAKDILQVLKDTLAIFFRLHFSKEYDHLDSSS
jgi:glycosyltransferase involved in cell wall biosynthesis